MLGPPLGAYLMGTSLWVPIVIGFMCLLLAVPLTVVMPETRFTALARESQGDEDAYHGPGSSESGEAPESQGGKVKFGIESRLKSVVGHTVSTMGFVVQHRNLMLLMVCFFSTDFAQQSLTVLLRYVSSRYSIPLAKVIASSFSRFNHYDAYLKICRSLGQLLVLLPGIRTNDGIWHRPSPPRHHAGHPVRTLASHQRPLPFPDKCHPSCYIFCCAGICSQV